VTTVNKKRKIKNNKNKKTIYQGENVYPLSFIRTNLGIFHSLVPSFTGKAGNTHSLGFFKSLPLSPHYASSSSSSPSPTPSPTTTTSTATYKQNIFSVRDF
jgi:hypothetical protein